MMFPYHIEVREDATKLANFKQRGFAKIMKRAWRVGVFDWVANSLPIHFTRQAHTRYAADYPKPDRDSSKAPLVLTGSLRAHILGQRGRGNVRGTAKGAYIQFRYGRPGQSSEEDLEEMIWARILLDRISYQEAQRKVYSAAGYSRQAKERFQRAIPAVHGSEVQRLKRVVMKHIVTSLNLRASLRRRKLS